jgi:hypothetical protein
MAFKESSGIPRIAERKKATCLASGRLAAGDIALPLV